MVPLTDFESQVSAFINRMAPFSDPKSARLTQLKGAKAPVDALLQFMIEKDLSPNALT